MGVSCISLKTGLFKSQGAVAFQNASNSYCSRFGERRESLGPEQTIEEFNMAAKKKAAKKKATKKKATKKKAAKKKKK
jgi:hypothetical protein